jgi:type IX secretion system PorP/SprF family membrane protein
MIWSLNAQQLPLYSDFIMNGFVLNPAMAGSEGYTTVGLSSRDQWAGLPYSPQTDVFGVQWRVLRQASTVTNNPFTQQKEVVSHSGRVGLGVYIYNDQNGLIQRTGAQFSYAYHIYINNRQLSFGLALNTFQFSIASDQFKFATSTPIDPLVSNPTFANRVLIPDATTGIYLLSYDSFYGFSASNLFESRIRIGSQLYDYRVFRTYYFMGGKRFNKDELFSFEPSMLLQASENNSLLTSVLQADFLFREYYNQDYYLGLDFRASSNGSDVFNPSAFGVQLGLKWERFYFSYAFEYTLTGIQSHTYGSHELNIALKLGDSARRYKWLIRY